MGNRQKVDRPDELVTSSDQLVARYNTLPEHARKAFVRHQRLLLEDFVRQQGMGPIEVQEFIDEIAGGFELTGEYGEAVVIRRQLVEFATQHVGTDEEAVLGHMEILAHDLFWVGQYEEAIELFDHVWRVRCRDLGRRDPRTVETEEYLATTLAYGGLFERSIELHKDVLEHHRAVYGEDDERAVQASDQLELVTKYSLEGGVPKDSEPIAP